MNDCMAAEPSRDRRGHPDHWSAPRKLTQVESYASTESGTDDLSLDAMGLEAVQCIIDISNGRWHDGAVVNGELKSRWQ